MPIYKYPLDSVKKKQIIELPERAKALSVAEQNGVLVIYFNVDNTRVRVNRAILVITTGDDAPTQLFKFVGTVPMDQGRYVVHVFA